jgi:uncharacterized repeat protein (TIGR01451 family)
MFPTTHSHTRPAAPRRRRRHVGHRAGRRAARPLGAALGSSAALLLVAAGLPFGATSASAAELDFPYVSDFTTDDGRASLTGDAQLVDGWLRLTEAEFDQAGAWQMLDTFPSDLGIDVTFDYAIHGGTGADGLAFFLTDGAAELGVGADGGALGYARQAPNGTPGIPGGYVGVGFDLHGEFSNPQFRGDGPGVAPDSIVVRGSGDGVEGYAYIDGVPSPSTLQMGSRQEARTARITIIPNQAGDLLLTVWTNTGPGTAMQRLMTDINLSDQPGQAPLPDQLRIGFSGGTGNQTNIHEVTDLRVTVPTDVSLTKTGPTDAQVGDQISWELTATNESTVPAPGTTVADDVPDTVTDVTWTCETSDDTPCDTGTGTGNSVAATADLEPGTSMQVTITGMVADDAGTEIVNNAVVTTTDSRNDTVPENNDDITTTAITAPEPDPTPAPEQTPDAPDEEDLAATGTDERVTTGLLLIGAAATTLGAALIVLRRRMS